MALVESNKIVEAIKSSLGLNEKMYTVIQVWDKELGALAKFATLEAIHKGQLIVEVTSSPVFQEMSFRKKEIINKINQHFGKERVVKSIKLKLKK
jgi:hypothetical protein